MALADRLRRAFGVLLVVAAWVILFASPGDGRAALARSAGGPVVSVITTGLTVPWDVAFLPDGRALVTERTGAVRIVAADGRLSPTPAARLTVSQNGEGGLLGLALDPAFSAGQPFVYLTATVGSEMQVQRWRMTGDTLVRDGVVIGGILMGSIHSSGRVRFGPDGALYVGTGDAGYGPRSQDLSVLNGKVLRVPPGAFRGARVTPEIHAIGLRNPQGFAWQPGSGRFFSTDHGPSVFDGPSGDDELDLIVPGGNYGWPFVHGANHGSWIAPSQLWHTTIAPSGLAFVTLPGSRWTNKALVAGLRGEVLRLLTFARRRAWWPTSRCSRASTGGCARSPRRPTARSGSPPATATAAATPSPPTIASCASCRPPAWATRSATSSRSTSRRRPRPWPRPAAPPRPAVRPRPGGS